MTCSKIANVFVSVVITNFMLSKTDAYSNPMPNNMARQLLNIIIITLKIRQDVLSRFILEPLRIMARMQHIIPK